MPRLKDSMGAEAPSDLRMKELFELGALYTEKERLTDWSYLEVPHPGPTYLRIHTQPRRYDMSLMKDWQERIVFENENFLIFNKPAGLPCHPMVDNHPENLLIELQQKKQLPLFLTHRLDRATHGLLLLAKNLAFQKAFNLLLAHHGVHKHYRAAVLTAPPWLKGHELLHYMIASPRAPKKLVRASEPGTQDCRLRVLEIDDRLLTLELLTGRTHQIRAQLSFEGYPIVGDISYGAPSEPWGPERIALQSFRLFFVDPLTEEDWHFQCSALSSMTELP